MKAKSGLLIALITIGVFNRPAAAQMDWLIEKTSGCCSSHGGVCGCSGGRDVCCDHSFSPSCTCSSTPNPTPRPTYRPTASPTVRPTPTPTAAPVSRSKPKKNLTSGAVLSVMLQDICTAGYTDKIRNVPSSVKRKVYQRYGVTPKKGQYEVDHLIPLELGGSNAISNLWPQPYNATWGARQKDRLENELHDLVCSGEMDLASAQQAIANDWIATYKSIFHTDRPL